MPGGTLPATVDAEGVWHPSASPADLPQLTTALQAAGAIGTETVTGWTYLTGGRANTNMLLQLSTGSRIVLKVLVNYADPAQRGACLNNIALTRALAGCGVATPVVLGEPFDLDGIPSWAMPYAGKSDDGVPSLRVLGKVGGALRKLHEVR